MMPLLHLLSALALYFFLSGPFYLIRHPKAIRRLPREARAFFWHLASLVRRLGGDGLVRPRCGGRL